MTPCAPVAISAGRRLSLGPWAPGLILAVLLLAACTEPARTKRVAEDQASPSTDKPAGYAGSAGCRECHEKFYALWSTSFHGLAMQPYTAELAKTKLTPQTKEIVAGKYRFRADLQTGVVIERSGDTSSAIRSCRRWAARMSSTS